VSISMMYSLLHCLEVKCRHEASCQQTLLCVFLKTRTFSYLTGAPQWQQRHLRRHAAVSQSAGFRQSVLMVSSEHGGPQSVQSVELGRCLHLPHQRHFEAGRLVIL
jgi:hypothetical protein